MGHPTTHTSAPTNVLYLLDFCIFLAALPAGCDCSEGVKLWHSPQSPAYTHTPTHTQTHPAGHPIWWPPRALSCCSPRQRPSACPQIKQQHRISYCAPPTPSSSFCSSYSSLLLLLLPMGLAWQCSLSPASASPCERDRERESEGERAWRNHTPRLIYCALSNYPW